MSAAQPLPPLELDHAAIATSPRPRRARLAALVLALVVVGGWPVAEELATRPINAVRVSGEFRRVERAALERAIAEQVAGVGFLGVDVGSVRRAALALPWVRAAAVRRVWPDRLYVDVEERDAVVRWNESALLEGDGARFEPRDLAGAEGLPHLVGPNGRHAHALAHYRAFDAALAGGPFGRIERLRLEPRGGWRIETSSGTEIVLGHGQGADDLARLVPAMRALGPGRGQEVLGVDMRYANGFALRLAPPPAEASPSDVARVPEGGSSG